MTTVREQWGVECPSCYSDEALGVTVRAMVHLTPDGADEDAASCWDHVWDGESSIMCMKCGHAGTVKDFAARPPRETTDD